jgi:hypothetical protein
MMPMPKSATAWEMEPQRKPRSVMVWVFMSGVMIGGDIAIIHEHRWKSIAFGLIVAALCAYNAWDRWRKIP